VIIGISNSHKSNSVLKFKTANDSTQAIISKEIGTGSVQEDNDG
jgi:hypothetical protein